jgi:hypothetical protein
MLTKRAWKVLRQMDAEEKAENHEDAEIVCEGFVCYLGVERISYRTVANLLAHCCVSSTKDEGSSMDRFSLNGTGRAALEDASVPERVRLAMAANTPIDQKGFPLPV